jgi:hypothetical protein
MLLASIADDLLDFRKGFFGKKHFLVAASIGLRAVALGDFL